MGYTVEFVEKTSKNGNPYHVLEITFPGGYKKLVFLDNAEIHILKTNSIETNEYLPQFKK